jgi:hypothetical protein
MNFFQSDQLFSAQWTRLLLSCVLALPIAALTTLPAKSQRPIRLTDLQCYQNVGSLSLENEIRNIVVNRQVYTAVAYLGPDRVQTEITCKLPPNAQTLSLTLAFDERDQRSSEWTLNFYIDGRPAVRVPVQNGARQTVRVDLRGAANLAVEAIVREGYRYGVVIPKLYMTEAEIQLQPGSGRRP